MPFTPGFIALAGRTNDKVSKYLRVYFRSEDEATPEDFSAVLNAMIDEARWHIVSSLKLHNGQLPDALYFSVTANGTTEEEKVFTSAEEAVLTGAGFVPDTQESDTEESGTEEPGTERLKLWSLELPLSWNLDARYKTFQERLEGRIDMGSPARRHGRSIGIAEHNAATLKQIVREVFNVTFDYSLKSLNEIDRIITMGQSEDNWQFRVFTPASLVACGDYAGEVARNIIPDTHWEDQERPLVLRTATASPRSKVTKLCVNGPGDSVRFLIETLQQVVHGKAL